MSDGLSRDEAQRLDKRIRLLVSAIHDQIDKLHDLVGEAKRGYIHVALGFPSWPAYLADVFTMPVRLDREKRREVVRWLSGEGLGQHVIADVVGVGVGTVNRDLSGVPNGTPEPVPDRYQVTNGRDDKTYKRPPPSHSGQESGLSDEWNTPHEVIKPATNVISAIDLDPSSTTTANEVVGASEFYTKEDDGLTKPWWGRVWLNPPYSQTAAFCAKLRQEYAAGNVKAAIVLVNNATETHWFQDLAIVASAICFPRGRIKFWHPDKSTSSAPLSGHAIFYLGDDVSAFVREFSPFGLTFPANDEDWR